MAASPLQVPEITLSIIGHLDPPTILSIRLVSFLINTLVLTHQRSICRSIAQRYYSINIDWPPPDIDNLQENFHLKTLTRLPKAYSLARRANAHCQCFTEASRVTMKAKRHAEVVVMKPTPLYSAFLARCTRAILITWTLNDIKQHLGGPGPLPNYISPSPPRSRRHGRLGRLFSRMTVITSKLGSESLSPVDANAHNIVLYMTALQQRSRPDIQEYIYALHAARQPYLQSLPRDYRVDLFWVQQYLYIGLPSNTNSRHNSEYYEKLYTLQQSPNFILSWCSHDECEKAWARSLARKVLNTRQSEYSLDLLDEREQIVSSFSGDQRLYDWYGLYEEAEKAREELTRGDWRHGGRET